ncbi:cell envelope integrity/translocation protein TolA [Bartonella vinsonii]|uniref:cell envelope integrity/translocation protein TolA n=1 Tax=Bartonella vinsonii TaxID=33047 RepID=UPI0002B6D5F2|nr:cell envelope integrity/translocation protein TolA [Bartonella vinsonii]AGF76411.1 TolA protein [Bartonella vinsonii subsp. berkhoffii str. Winnie]
MNKGSYHSMKRSLTLSLAGHVVLLSWAGGHFISPVSLPQQLEAIPITLAPLTQELSSQKGAVNAPVREIPAVKPTTKPQEKEVARHFGEGLLDSLAPFRQDEKPRPIEATPPPSGEKNPLEKPLPEFTEQEISQENTQTPPKIEVPLETPQEDAPKLKPEAPLEMPQEGAQKLKPEAPLETSENKEKTLPQEPAPTISKTSIKPAPQQIFPITLPDNFPLPQSKPKSPKQSTSQSAQEIKKQNQQIKDQTIEDILASEENNLLNRARTQRGGAKRSRSPEALGARKNMGDTTKMAQTLVSIAGGCIQQKLKLVALGGDLKNRPIVRLRFYLNRQGMVMGDPIIDPLSGAESQQAIMIRQVYAAVFSCQPYADLPRDQYDLWGQGFDFNVDPLQEITR